MLKGSSLFPVGSVILMEAADTVISSAAPGNSDSCYRTGNHTSNKTYRYSRGRCRSSDCSHSKYRAGDTQTQYSKKPRALNTFATVLILPLGSTKTSGLFPKNIRAGKLSSLTRCKKSHYSRIIQSGTKSIHGQPPKPFFPMVEIRP